MTAPAETSLTKFARLDAFLQRMRDDIYPELPTQMHTDLSAKMFDAVRRAKPLPAGAKVLDIGCGQGVALELFRDAGFDAVGITLGDDVAACRAKGLNAIEMDFTFLEFPDAEFDLVWCRHALEHSVMPFFTLSEMRRVLKPGGVLYVEVPAPDTSCKHQTNANHYSVLGKSMWLELIRRSGFGETRAVDLPLATGAGPDVYWAFLTTNPA